MSEIVDRPKDRIFKAGKGASLTLRPYGGFKSEWNQEQGRYLYAPVSQPSHELRIRIADAPHRYRDDTPGVLLFLDVRTDKAHPDLIALAGQVTSDKSQPCEPLLDWILENSESVGSDANIVSAVVTRFMRLRTEAANKKGSTT